MGQLEIVVSLAEELSQLCGEVFHSALFLVALQRYLSCSNIKPVFHYSLALFSREAIFRLSDVISRNRKVANRKPAFYFICMQVTQLLVIPRAKHGQRCHTIKRQDSA